MCGRRGRHSRNGTGSGWRSKLAGCKRRRAGTAVTSYARRITCEPGVLPDSGIIRPESPPAWPAEPGGEDYLRSVSDSAAYRSRCRSEFWMSRMSPSLIDAS